MCGILPLALCRLPLKGCPKITKICLTMPDGYDIMRSVVRIQFARETINAEMRRSIRAQPLQRGSGWWEEPRRHEEVTPRSGFSENAPGRSRKIRVCPLQHPKRPAGGSDGELRWYHGSVSRPLGNGGKAEIPRGRFLLGIMGLGTQKLGLEGGTTFT